MYAADPANYAFYFTGESPETFNAYGYDNPRVTELLRDARYELDFEKRAFLYHEAVRTIHDELPVLVVFHFRDHLAWRAELQGVRMGPPGGLLFLSSVHR